MSLPYSDEDKNEMEELLVNDGVWSCDGASVPNSWRFQFSKLQRQFQN